jgi:hypothetical protein
MSERRPIVLDDLPRPLQAGHRERLRLHLIAAVFDGARPALLIGEDGRGNGGASAAMSIASRIAAPRSRLQRNASHRSIAWPSPSVNATLSARGIDGSPKSRPAIAPRSRWSRGSSPESG